MSAPGTPPFCLLQIQFIFHQPPGQEEVCRRNGCSHGKAEQIANVCSCLLYTSPQPDDLDDSLGLITGQLKVMLQRIGGGSSMDTAKAIGIIINNPEFAMQSASAALKAATPSCTCLLYTSSHCGGILLPDPVADEK